MARRFHIRTFGCQMNEHDSERLAGLLESDGMEATDDVEQADVVVLNTCCIRENADNKLYGHLGHLASLKVRKPGLKIVVGGCLAQKDKGEVQKRARYVDVVLGTHNVGRVVQLVHQADQDGPVMEIVDQEAAMDEPFAVPTRRRLPYSAWVTIQTGCNNSCSFCIVPQVRGAEVSRPFGELLGEVESLAAKGVSEITLLGQNVNSYGRDIATSLRAGPVDYPSAVWMAGEHWVGQAKARARPLFADLLRAVGLVAGIERVRFTSPHPKDLRPETIAAMAETKEVCEHLHLPLQSGSDRVLSAMRRGYTAERYMQRLAHARRDIPDLAVTTDLIVGFPGESEDDFRRTLEVVAEAEYDSTYTFIFSPRPGTTAATMVDELIPAPVVAERFERLKVVVERSALVRHRARLGRLEEVLVEGPSKRDPEITTGRTRQSKLVHFAVPDHATLRPGSNVTVRVTSAAPHHLGGEIVGRVELPLYRDRIPVSSA
ncbi:MAG: MiaB/RimO family radical SAM methylthiotransferase [Acidimicrobiales bacterium]